MQRPPHDSQRAGNGRSLDGRIVVLTGATGGIGQRAALRLGTAGCRLVLVSRSLATLEALRAQLSSRGVSCVACTADVRRPADWDAVRSRALDAFGGIDVLIHAAGTLSAGPLAGMPAEDIRAQIDTNLLGAALGTAALLPDLQRSSRAQILFIGSLAAYVPLPFVSIYTATKFGLCGLARALQQELHDTAVRVTILHLGAVETPMLHAESRVPDASYAFAGPIVSADAAAAAIEETVRRPRHESLRPFGAGMFCRLAHAVPSLLFLADPYLRRHGGRGRRRYLRRAAQAGAGMDADNGPHAPRDVPPDVPHHG